MNAGKDGRRRHMARGAETSGGGSQVAGVGNIQVENVLRRDRICRAVAVERCYDDERLLMGGGSRMAGSRKIQKGLRQVGREGL